MLIINLNANELRKQQFTRSKDTVKIIELEKNEQYSLAYGELDGLAQNKKHKMTLQELYYIIAGKGVMIVNDNNINVKKGMIIRIDKDSEQKIVNSSRRKLRFLMFVNPPYNEDDEILLE